MTSSPNSSIGRREAVPQGSAAGEAYQAVGDPAAAFRFGLDRILDGVAILIESKGKNA